MGVQDRDWYREAYANKEKKYNGNFSLNKENEQNFYDAIWDEVNKNEYGGKRKNRKKTRKPEVKNNSPNNITSNQNGGYIFLGKTLKVEHKSNGYFTKCACGNCNCITEVKMQNKPSGTYNYVCPKCKSTNEFKANYTSLGTWILFFISLAILYFMIFG